MALLITAEHIDLSAENKEEIAKILGKLEAMLQEDSQTHLFLKPESGNSYKAILNVHHQHRDYSAHDEGSELLHLVRSVKKTLIRKLHGEKDKKVHARRMNSSYDSDRDFDELTQEMTQSSK